MTLAAAVNEIPPEQMRELMRNTGAANEVEAVRLAVAKVNRLAELERIAQEIEGSVPSYMSHDELMKLRERTNPKPD